MNILHIVIILCAVLPMSSAKTYLVSNQVKYNAMDYVLAAIEYRLKQRYRELKRNQKVEKREGVPIENPRENPKMRKFRNRLNWQHFDMFLL